jgi:hypothetical protein
MANIKLKDLVGHDVIGANLFNDSESFMLDLSDRELDIHGGCGRTQPIKIGANTLHIIIIYSCATVRQKNWD